MASKVLVPAAPFAKLQVKKSPPEQGSSGFIIGGDATARIAHLEHSVRFLQEQHRLMLSGLHAEIEALRERNRDLQFQLIFNKESSPKPSPPATEEITENDEEVNLKKETARLEREAAAARGEARAAEARALQLQRLVDAQAEKLRELELRTQCVCSGGGSGSAAAVEGSDADETRAELRARLVEAERLVRRLRGDAERQRREVLAATAGGVNGVTNLLFDGAHATHAHLHCMKNSLHASLRASGLDGYGYQNNYHFPPLHAPEFWREPLREEFSVGNHQRNAGLGRARRPITLPELAGQQIHRSTVYANNHARQRPNGYDHKKKVQSNGDAGIKTPEDQSVHRIDPAHASSPTTVKRIKTTTAMYPELKVVIAKMISNDNAVTAASLEPASRSRPRRHRKHAPDHT